MISLFFHLILIFCLHCQSFLRISGFTKICNKKITFQCKIFIVPEEGWFRQPKYSTHIKTFLRCTGFCLYFLHFIYVKPVRSPLIQRTPAGSSFRLLAQTFYSRFFLRQWCARGCHRHHRARPLTSSHLDFAFSLTCSPHTIFTSE